MTEIRAADLRLTPAETGIFLNHVMGLNLSAADIAALEARTEGWIAGLQLAALSMQGHDDVGGFIRSFTGSHAYIAGGIPAPDRARAELARHWHRRFGDPVALPDVSGCKKYKVQGRNDHH